MIDNLNFISIQLLLSIIGVCLYFFFLEKIKLLINIYDDSNLDNRKIHSGKVPPIGGVIIYILFVISSVFNILENLQNDQFFTIKEQVTLLFSTSLIFFTGLLDDKYSLRPLNKSIIFLILILIFLLNNPDINIYFIRFELFSKVLALGDFSLFFTLFCIFCFMNAFNMYDGINLQSGLYSLFIFIIFFFKNIDNFFTISLIISLIFFLYYNFKNKIFFGNNGSYLVSFLISIYLIKSNIVFSKISVEEILILLLIPGMDMLRLFIFRLIKGKSPFLPDNNHIHHLIFKKNNDLLLTVIIIFTLTVLPYLIFIFLYKSPLILLLQILLYLIILKFITLKQSNFIS